MLPGKTKITIKETGLTMSVNFHAFQNKGVLFAECEALCEQWHREFSGYKPERIAGILNLDYDETHIRLTYFQTAYRMRLKDGRLEKQTESGWTQELYFNESMAIYHVLKYTVDMPLRTGVWVPNEKLDRVVSRSTRLSDPLLTPFAKLWSGRCEELSAACENVGGRKLDKGDVAYQFAAFPFMDVQLVYWDQDEDFPAQVQVLFDERVTDYIHFETSGCIVADLLEKISARSS